MEKKNLVLDILSSLVWLTLGWDLSSNTVLRWMWLACSFKFPSVEKELPQVLHLCFHWPSWTVQICLFKNCSLRNSLSQISQVIFLFGKSFIFLRNQRQSDLMKRYSLSFFFMQWGYFPTLLLIFQIPIIQFLPIYFRSIYWTLIGVHLEIM